MHRGARTKSRPAPTAINLIVRCDEADCAGWHRVAGPLEGIARSIIDSSSVRCRRHRTRLKFADHSPGEAAGLSMTWRSMTGDRCEIDKVEHFHL